jgi:nitroreductase
MDEKLTAFYELFKRRRSVREFQDREVEEEKTERLLEILQRAQSAANCQPWHFIISRGEDLLRFDDIFTKEGFKKAPLVITALAEPSKAWTRKADGVNYAWVDVAIAVTEMISAATAEGLGTCWIGALDPGKVKRELRIPDHIEVVGIIALGYPAKPLEVKEKPRKKLDEIIHYNGW